MWVLLVVMSLSDTSLKGYFGETYDTESKCVAVATAYNKQHTDGSYAKCVKAFKSQENEHETK